MNVYRLIGVCCAISATQVNAVDVPNQKDALTCVYDGQQFELGDPILLNGKLHFCAYDGGPTTVWLSEEEYTD